MKRQFTLEVILICTVFLAACGQTSNSSMRVNLYDTFDKSHHLRPEFPKADFNTLRDWDFGWFLLEPLNIAESLEHEVELSKQFSPGQKALYFYWFLDAEVTNG